MLYLSRDDVRSVITYEDCVKACEEGLINKGRGDAEDPVRIRLNANGAGVWFMPAMDRVRNLVGTRLQTFAQRTNRMCYMLWDGTTGEPLVMMDALWIRDYRTGAVGAVGAKYMARPESKTIGVIGSSRQARSGLGAHAAVFNLTHCKVFSPTKENREAYAREMGEELSLDITPVDSAEEACRDVDIVITGTGGTLPEDRIFFGKWYQPGMHVSSIGARSELDDEAITRADIIIIDAKSQFPHECVDVTDQVNRGLLTWDDIGEIHEIIDGSRPGRNTPNDITLLKTVGTAVQDLLPAAVVYQRAVEQGMGKDLGDLFPTTASPRSAPRPAHG
jgi:ornithine cyclodeaminase/alanine dehydrogenase-like protein (mu-crystallin family)